ncbi:MAG: hypothetical protein ROR55_19705 [Devosia sp.]
MTEKPQAENMTPCKVQVDQTGTSILIYNEDRSVLGETDNPSVVEQIRDGFDLNPLEKIYVQAAIHDDGFVEFGNVLPEQDW